MKNNLFSERYRYKPSDTLKPDVVPDSLRNRIWNLLKDSIETGLTYKEGNAIHKDSYKVIEIIWDEFFEEDIDNLRKKYGVYTESYT